MSLLKISDPKKRDEIVKEFTERKKRIYQDSVNNNLSEASFQTDLTKMYKPLLDSNNTIKESLKGAADKLREGMLSITSSTPALTSLPPIESDSNPNKPKASRSTKYRELIKPIWDEVKLKNKGKKGQVLFFFQEIQMRLLKSWI